MYFLPRIISHRYSVDKIAGYQGGYPSEPVSCAAFLKYSPQWITSNVVNFATRGRVGGLALVGRLAHVYSVTAPCSALGWSVEFFCQQHT